MKPITHRPIRAARMRDEQLRERLGNAFDTVAGARLLRTRLERRLAGLPAAAQLQRREGRIDLTTIRPSHLSTLLGAVTVFVNSAPVGYIDASVWTHGDWINMFVAVGTILLAAFAFWQIVSAKLTEPRLDLRPDSDGVETRLEGRRPWIRLIVENGRGRRVARHTRVVVQSYRKTHFADPPVSLAGPELGWPSTSLAEGAGAVVFGGTSKPIDFGSLGIGPTDPSPNPLEYMYEEDRVDLIQQGTHQWWFQLRLEMNARGVYTSSLREFLPPQSGGYTARLVVGADDGEARTFDVQFSWASNAGSAEQALGSLLLSVSPVRQKRTWWRAS